MNFQEDTQNFKQKQDEKLENICEVCGAGNALSFRITTHPELERKDDPFGFMCSSCYSSGRGDLYVKKILDIKCKEDKEYKTLIGKLEKLSNSKNFDPDSLVVKNITDRLDELKNKQEVRKQLAERFHGIRQDEILSFFGELGQGDEQEKCEVCGQKHPYLFIFVDVFEDHEEVINEISFWACANCILNNRVDTHSAKVLSEFTMFREVCDGAKCDSLNKSTFKHELAAQEDMYKRKAVRMEKARLAYKGKKIMAIVMINGDRDSSVLCRTICR